MTLKERIDAFVLNQGNQVGAGAELAAILNDILDAIPSAYTLPPASANTLGGIKVGSGLSVTEQGVLSASAQGPMILEGTIAEVEDEENTFNPAANFPSYSELLAAIAAGRPIYQKVLLRSLEGEDYTYFAPVSITYDPAEGATCELGKGQVSYIYEFLA